MSYIQDYVNFHFKSISRLIDTQLRGMIELNEGITIEKDDIELMKKLSKKYKYSFDDEYVYLYVFVDETNTPKGITPSYKWEIQDKRLL